ncbi:MAG: riboflavin synthase [Phycisphaeraceae bacterium]|nr:riboflavin synthase [Phycisphaeraceae bacterium]
MFTGIIETTGVVSRTTASDAGLRLVVAAPHWAYCARRGDSVAVNGCCLTAIADVGGDGDMAFDAIPETLAKTTLAGLLAGERVNLEHAATASTLLGGHLVQGHVDGVSLVEKVSTRGEWRVRLRPPAEIMPFLAPKGSVTLDGVSLTLAQVSPAEGWFEVALIPTTLEKTTLGAWMPGARVNTEADAMAKTVVNFLRHFAAMRTTA